MNSPVDVNFFEGFKMLEIISVYSYIDSDVECFESVLLNVHLDVSGGVYFLSIVALVFCFL